MRPTVENGFQYAAVDGGKSGSVEPTWPTTINATVGDGTIQWTAVPVDERIPFCAWRIRRWYACCVYGYGLYQNASITSAKISELVADKIETGNLIADLQVMNKLWYGFEEFANGTNQTGFWLGVEGGIPKFRLDTGASTW